MILPIASERDEGNSSHHKTMTSNEEDIQGGPETRREVKEPTEDRDPLQKDSKKVPARRKPEKSRIVRVWQNDESKNQKCPHCLSEILNEEDLERHLLSCKTKSPSPNLSYENIRADPFSKYRGEASPDNPENSVYGSSNQESAPAAGDYTQVLKLLRNAVPQMSNSQQLALEVILNAQMSLSRMGGALNNDNEALNQEQNMPLHQQQLLQLQLIQLLQAQLNVNGEKNAATEDKYNRENGERSLEESPFLTLKDRMSLHEKENEQREVLERKSSLTAKITEESAGSKIKSNNIESSRRSVSPLTTKGISSLVIQHPDSPPPGGPNTLEMLQKTADEVLNNASKGLLASRLIDSCREADNGDPNRRHRCRYCGKVFSSDSGLQIHIRSHTGERPFKCNVCGNRFTTKGNLKVHFQRHSDQFPNIKMNPHPVPEHLDKFYPPLLPQNSEHMNENSSLPVSSPSSIAVSPITSTTPPFKPIGVRPPLNLNFKNISDSLLKPPGADSIGRDIARNFLDFRLFPPFLVPPLAKPNLELNPEPPKESRREPEEKRDEIEERSRENVRSPFHCESVKVEKDDEDDDDETSSQNGLPLETEKESLANNNEDQSMDSLNILRQNFMGTNLPESKNLYRDIIDFKENSDSLDEDASHQPLNLKSNKSVINSSYENLREKPDDEEKKNDEQDESYMSDSSSTTNDKTSKNDNALNGSPVEFSHLPFLGIPGPPNISLLQNLQLPFPGPPHPNAHGPPFPVPPGLDPSKVPHIYTNLLPRPGSTDNSWEALIEVKKSNENQKIEQLIDKNKEKPTEPNQCAICQRVLSCKSALQMHYRVHTGERPFKCKICCRSFTTKGNLKTHMSVHRAKPPMRMLQQCPICHKKFSNALILQQHIRLHTGEPTDLSPEQIYAAEVRDFPHDIPVPLRFPPIGPGGLPPHMQPRSPFAPLPLPLHFYGPQKLHRKEDSLEAKYGSLFNSSPRSSSTSSAEQHSAEDLSMRMRDDDGLNDPISSRSYMISPTLSDYSDLDDKSEDTHKEGSESQENHSKELLPLGSAESAQYGMIGEHSSHPMALGFPPSIPGFASMPKDGPIKPPMFPFFPPLGLLSPMKHNPNAMQNFNIQGMPPMTEGNTTCKVCFKIFACQSALEIHLRSHTKERPFKCSYCDRGFSTKGNMKQHMATHKTKENTEDNKPSSSPSSDNSLESHRLASSAEASTSCATSAGYYPSGEEAKDEDKTDSRIKREREGEISLPEAKRSSGVSESNGDANERGSPSPALNGEEDGEPKERRDDLHPSPPNQLQHHFFSTTMNPPATSIPFPPSICVPSTSSFHGLSSFPFGGGPRNNSSGGGGLQLPLPLSLPLSLASPLPIPKSDSLHG